MHFMLKGPIQSADAFVLQWTWKMEVPMRVKYFLVETYVTENSMQKCSKPEEPTARWCSMLRFVTRVHGGLSTCDCNMSNYGRMLESPRSDCWASNNPFFAGIWVPLLSHDMVEKWEQEMMACMAWLIWLAWNSRVYQNQFTSPQDLGRQLICYYVDVWNYIISPSCTHSKRRGISSASQALFFSTLGVLAALTL